MIISYSYQAASVITRLLAACVVVGVLLFSMPGSAEAAFYKCVSADGSTTYNDTPCAADESAYRLNKHARNTARLDCRIASNFASDAVARMRQGASASDVFQAYGGAKNLSEGVRNLINYVYSFNDDKMQASAQRIVVLTTERCEAGLLGRALEQCDTFPSAFIQSFGNCVAARQPEQSVLVALPENNRSNSRSSQRKRATESNQTIPQLDEANPVIDP